MVLRLMYAVVLDAAVVGGACVACSGTSRTATEQDQHAPADTAGAAGSDDASPSAGRRHPGGHSASLGGMSGTTHSGDLSGNAGSSEPGGSGGRGATNGGDGSTELGGIGGVYNAGGGGSAGVSGGGATSGGSTSAAGATGASGSGGAPNACEPPVESGPWSWVYDCTDDCAQNTPCKGSCGYDGTNSRGPGGCEACSIWATNERAVVINDSVGCKLSCDADFSFTIPMGSCARFTAMPGQYITFAEAGDCLRAERKPCMVVTAPKNPRGLNKEVIVFRAGKTDFRKAWVRSESFKLENDPCPLTCPP